MDTHIEFLVIVVNKFLSNKINPKLKEQNSKNENNRCMILLYVGNASLYFKTALITQFKVINYHCNVNFRAFKVHIFH